MDAMTCRLSFNSSIDTATEFSGVGQNPKSPSNGSSDSARANLNAQIRDKEKEAQQLQKELNNTQHSLFREIASFFTGGDSGQGSVSGNSTSTGNASPKEFEKELTDWKIRHIRP
jgi:hypothetical protein